LQLTDGSYVTANDAFLREAILNPSTRVTSGYAPIMPTYQGQVSEEGLIDLVEYIKNLNSNYRIQQTLTASQLSPGQAGASSSGSSSPAMNGPAKAGRTAPGVPTVNQ
jgi:cytochrome c oxidase subunit 2